jgi:hypothetical protein
MKPYRGALLAFAVLLSILPLIGCGDAEDGGTDPSGSHIRVVSVSPATLEPDISETDCGNGTTDGLTNSYVTVTLKNESAPTTPTDTSTNSYVTMSSYRVDFVGLDKAVQIPSIDGGGQSVGLSADGTEKPMTVLVTDIATLKYIRAHYPPGSGSLRLLGKITLSGTDAFQVTVSTEADVTLVVADYNRCDSSVE